MTYDLTGKRFGKLTVLEKAGRQGTSQLWLCRCDCGNLVKIRANSLVRLGRDSCGCRTSEKISKARFLHGETNSRLYNIWRSIKKRCLLPKTQGYKNYGGRGIEVCEEWKNSYLAFRDWALKNGYKEDLEIDRINVNGNYEPNNCRFVNNKQQANNRRNNRLLSVNGEIKTIQEWADIMGVQRSLIANRKKLGWSDYDAVTKKPRKHNIKGEE